MRNKILVIGSGRSGTHWIGNVLGSHPLIKIFVESKLIFKLVTTAAINKNRKNWVLPFIIFYYKIIFCLFRNVVDKSHPNIWHAFELKKAIKSIKFIGIYREPLATVSSMLKHEGVRRWCENWKDYPIPNKMLGISEDNIDEYAELPLESKCAMRVIVHYKELIKIKNSFPDDTLLIDYEKLMTSNESILRELSKFLDIENHFSPMKIKYSSKDKWKNELNKEQIKNIQETIRKHGAELQEYYQT